MLITVSQPWRRCKSVALTHAWKYNVSILNIGTRLKEEWPLELLEPTETPVQSKSSPAQSSSRGSIPVRSTSRITSDVRFPGLPKTENDSFGCKSPTSSAPLCLSHQRGPMNCRPDGHLRNGRCDEEPESRARWVVYAENVTSHDLRASNTIWNYESIWIALIKRH